MNDDLFSAAARELAEQRGPLASKVRPRTLDEIVGQDELLGPGKPLRTLIEEDRLTSIILWGPPGCGKTTLARLIASHTTKSFETLSAVSASVKDVRQIISGATARLGERGVGTILFLDEVHRFSKSQQDALLPSVEDGLLVLIGATTENPYFEVNAPLLSRSNLFRLSSLAIADVVKVMATALEIESAEATPEALEHLAERSDGDARRALTALDVAIVLARSNGDGIIRTEQAEQALDQRAVRYGVDDHYDVTSAFIKSIRGSDPDASMHWLARMIEAGEAPRFIARRLVVLASEDVGLADPQALTVATSAAAALELVGLPEAAFNLSQATLYLARAPKSNAVAAAWTRASSDVRSGEGGAVPVHLRDAHYGGAKKLGHGQDYKYPHDYESGWVEQQYLPDDLEGRKYFKDGGSEG